MKKTKHTITKENILDAGHPLIAAKGFTGVGLSELLRAAQIPKGSFYHYFESKEQYGCELLSYYFENYLSSLKHTLIAQPNTDTSAYQRLMTYFERWAGTQSCCDFKNRCLVVKLSAEVSDLSDHMRIILFEGTQKIMAQITDCIQHGLNDLSISPKTVTDPPTTSKMLYQLWLGASLLTKLEKEPHHLEAALKVTYDILKPD